MARPVSLTQQLRRVGVRDLDRVAQWITTGAVPLLACAADVDLLARAGDPDQAVLALMRLSETASDWSALGEGARARLVSLVGSSRAGADYLYTHPSARDEVLECPPDLPVDLDEALAAGRQAGVAARMAFLRALEATEVRPGTWVAGGGDADTLRRVYRTRLYALAAADLAAPDPLQVLPAVAAHLAGLADAAIEAALALARRSVDPAGTLPFAVLALGKTGGVELNYLSDVDVMYVVGEGEDDPRVSLDRAGRLAVALAQALSGPGREPPLWELDLGLRPEGKDGALVRTVASYREYYATWAKNWEFQALLKARAAAGDLALAEGLLEALTPLVWEAATREGFVEEARAMRERVEDHIPAKERPHQLKLGPGGLRDVEFSVQLLQLVHGRVDPTLRCRSTLEAIRALAAGGYIGRDAGQTLSECYRFLRVLEHRAQLERMRRTHLMPTRERDLTRISRTLWGREGDAEAVQARWSEVRQTVRDLHHDLFYRPLLSIAAREGAQEIRLSPQAGEERLRFLGYRDPASALRHIEALTDGVSRRAAIQRALMPGILEWLTLGPDPDGGLLGFRCLSDAIGSSHWYLGLLRDSRVAAKRLCQILATSPFIAARLAHQPQAVQWLDAEDALAPIAPARLAGEVRALGERHTDLTDALDRIRGVREREVVRAGLADLTLGLTVERGARMVSQASEVCLAEAFGAARRAVEGAADGLALGLIAMGRLGGREAGYGSDADCTIVYVDRSLGEPRAAEVAHRVAAVFRDGLQAAGTHPGIAVDFDLRPEGKQGALARSLDSYVTYYRRWASVWERQALVRARMIAGEDDLRAAWEDAAGEICWGCGLTTGAAREIRLLKARMETERLPRGVEPARHVKLGPGGLSDVEWAVQMCQLTHAHADPALRVTGTCEALNALTAGGYMDPGDAQILADAWVLASRIRAANVLAHDRVSVRRRDIVPTNPADLVQVGRILGYEPGREADLAEDYRRVSRRAREVAHRLIYDRPTG